MRSSATPPGLVMTAIGLPRSVTTTRSPAFALRRYSLSRFLICLIPTVIIEPSYVATISYFVDTLQAPELLPYHIPREDRLHTHWECAGRLAERIGLLVT